MSFMTEKKALEVFKMQMQAELTGPDQLARDLENQLNDAGWFITSGPDGPTIKRKDGTVDASAVDWLYAPKESTVAPNSSSDNPNGRIWRNVGIAVLVAIGIVLIIWGSVKLYQKFKSKGNATA
ncbi:MAG: hypothetical protein A3D31_08360 [Candidatus Fluviicola riflensis]|nr:MAG: hypothetical protein CHH17_06640 [Candidatus Fluviicola riflensis]OGS79952.1 MAG: hypothetical protein A3D31_08360 [Candidatus Fluviicola riflensis]OGS82467.1 MAG: hypothetical protein A2724_17305 [Fluviicola sp. RIFCSPHIGHO2_01_FULL_43_53]OGS88131.1 MAG: hypothetical protein A3E30_14740 [Fluviicola sp. RIFCSPHIGHO2_12_FULL_43_24]